MIDRNDPRLTAYALGEMDPAERAEFEKELAADTSARRATVASTNQTKVAVPLARPGPCLSRRGPLVRKGCGEA